MVLGAKDKNDFLLYNLWEIYGTYGDLGGKCRKHMVIYGKYMGNMLIYGKYMEPMVIYGKI